MGFDCGSRQAGCGVLDITDDYGWCVTHAKLFKMKAKHTFAERVAMLAAFARDQIAELEPDIVAIEDLKFNKGAKNLSSMGKVAMAIGGVMAQTVLAGYEPVLITATTARSRLSARTKDQARKKLNERFEDDLASLGYAKGIMKAQEDVSDALVLCYAATLVANRDPDTFRRKT